MISDFFFSEPAHWIMQQSEAYGANFAGESEPLRPENT
jgi:hypothetical protein